MADRYLLESSAIDGYLLEDGSGVLLIESASGTSRNLLLMGVGGWIVFFCLLRLIFD